MLRNAIRKDLLLNGNQFWGLIPWFAWAAYALGQEHMGAMTAVSGAMIGALMTVTICAREDKFHATAALASLPVTRRTLVWARYLLAFATGAASLVIVAGMAAMLPWSVQTAAEAFDPNTLLLGATVASVSAALLMPLAIRFGLVGVVGFFAVMQVVGIALLVLPAALGMKDVLRGAFRAAERGFIALHASLDQPVPIIQTAAVVAIAVWISFQLSVFLVDRQDL
jgi:ABC-type transport system involved in multi-copper enzyme maturation permease subunit